MKILNVQSSVNLETSHTRAASRELIAALRARIPSAVVIDRDLAAHPVPHLSPMGLQAYGAPQDPGLTPQQKAILRVSDELVAEILAADLLILGSPMYNFSVPSGLKAYVDAISRAGLTFKYTPQGPVGLISDKKRVIIVSSSGGDYGAEPSAAFEMNDRYLRVVLGFLGLRKIDSLGVPGTAMGPQAVADSRARFTLASQRLVSQLSQLEEESF